MFYVCSVAAGFLPLLSDQPPDLAKRAEFGGRFHYWRGCSGRRYLFSVVPAESLADFRSAVVILAESTGDGRLAAHTVAIVGNRGCLRDMDGPRPPRLRPCTKVLLHFLATTDADRLRIVEDITGVSAVRLAA
jgi:hypothetical protein